MGRPVLGLTGGRPPLPDGGLDRPAGPLEGRRGVGSVDGDGASAGRPAPPRALGPDSAWRGRPAEGASRDGAEGGRRSVWLLAVTRSGAGALVAPVGSVPASAAIAWGLAAGSRVSVDGVGAGGADGAAAAAAPTSGPAAAGSGAAAAGRAGSGRGLEEPARDGRAPASSGASATPALDGEGPPR